MTRGEQQTCKLWIVIIGACLVVLLGLPCRVSASELRASVTKVDITPEKSEWLGGYDPRQSTGVRDRIFHRIVALDDGNTQFYLISSEFGSFSPSVYRETMAALQAQTGIKPQQVWWTFTHTHSAPEVGPPDLSGVYLANRFHHPPNTEYTSWIEQRLIEGIKQAKSKLEPARLGVGWGFSRANINRRARDEEGSDILGMNPDGATDRRIGIIRLEKADGTLLAVIANYAMHGTVLGPSNTLISGDAPGVVANYVEKKLGVPMLYINGAAGNLAPIYSVPNLNANKGYLEQFSVLLGDRILEANRRITSTTANVQLTVGQITIETPRKPGIGWVEDLGDYIRKTSTGQTVVRMPVDFLSINKDIVIWSAPIELFCEVSNYIRDHSQYPYTFYFGYSNGWLGYLPTKDEYARGGYEINTSPFTDEAEQDVKEGILTYLDGLP